jgi:hemerythrin-like domain-containing protein
MKKSGKTPYDSIDEAAEETFPTSDPPSWTLGSDKEFSLAFSEEVNHVRQVIANEHHVIRKVAQALEKIIHALLHNMPVAIEHLKDLYEFMDLFVVHRHYIKEEILFPLIRHNQEGPSDYLLNDLLTEHEVSREQIETLKLVIHHYETKQPKANEELAHLLSEMKHFQLNHIAKEESNILPHLNNIISDKQNLDLLKQFDKIDEMVDKNVYERIALLAEKIIHG